MPYIKEEYRQEFLDNPLKLPEDPGSLNYYITDLLLDYVITKGESYKTYNEVIGVLECVKQEFYRRAVAPYEDVKCEINGDVFYV